MGLDMLDFVVLRGRQYPTTETLSSLTNHRRFVPSSWICCENPAFPQIRSPYPFLVLVRSSRFQIGCDFSGLSCASNEKNVRVDSLSLPLIVLIVCCSKVERGQGATGGVGLLSENGKRLI